MATKIVKQITLVAPTSPKRAFYTISLICTGFDTYNVIKESGISVASVKVCDRRSWQFGKDAERAAKFFNSKVNAKLRPNRPGRSYVLSLPGFI